MRINLTNKSLRKGKLQAVMMKTIAEICRDIAAEYDTEFDHNLQYFFLEDSEGQKLLAKKVKERHNLTIDFWKWETYNQTLSQGIEINEDEDLTKFLLTIEQ